jgi:hypothetical protein
MRTTVRSAQSAFHLSEVRIELPVNAFKRALIERRQQIGLWCSLPGAYVAEALAGSGFDWMLFDTEHSPGDPLTVLAQLQAVAPYPVSPVVRPASNDPVLIKRFLDIGAQTRLIPYVQSAEEARKALDASAPHLRGAGLPPRFVRAGGLRTRPTAVPTGSASVSSSHDDPNLSRRSSSRQSRYRRLANIEATRQVSLARATVGERIQSVTLLMSGKLWRSTHMNPTPLGASSTFPGSGTYQLTFNLGEAAKNREHQSAMRHGRVCPNVGQ